MSLCPSVHKNLDSDENSSIGCCNINSGTADLELGHTLAHLTKSSFGPSVGSDGQDVLVLSTGRPRGNHGAGGLSGPAGRVPEARKLLCHLQCALASHLLRMQANAELPNADYREAFTLLLLDPGYDRSAPWPAFEAEIPRTR